MKIVAFNGSPRKKGNTEILINEVLKILNDEERIKTMEVVGENMAWC